MRFAAVLVLFAAGCLQDDLVRCANGLLCPRGTACDAIHATCVSPAQTTACTGLADGDVCTADGTRAICDQGTCLPGCGDGAQGTGEECDDGNFASHDGCSSTCLRELASWVRWTSPWSGRSSQVAGYLPGRDEIVIGTGADPLGEYDVQWTRDASRTWTSGTTPLGRRQRAASAVDPIRGRLVVFGGQRGATALGDTWEYDGTQWINATPSNGPSPRTGGAMVFDKVRGRIVLFGGRTATMLLNDTWEWDGTSWTPVTTTEAPAPRFQAGFAWDTPGQRAILFGGQFSAGLIGDTWQYKDATWTPLAPAASPTPRDDPSMAELPGANAIVLFGGRTGDAASDTWHFSGSSWTSKTPATSPSARTRASLVFCRNPNPTKPDLVVLVGGETIQGAVLDDVWEYDGLVWADRSPAFSPTPRTTRLSYDPARHTIVMYGGLLGNGGAPNETWVFSATAGWSARGGAGFSPFRWRYGMTYDSTRRHVILFGGSDTAIENDTWLWDGQVWTKSNAMGPSARTHAGLVDVARDGTVMLFGGTSAEGITLRDTWEYDGATWTARSTPDELVAAIRPAMAYDPNTERAYLVDGAGVTWTFAEHVWQRATTAGSPPIRSGAASAYDPWRRRIVRFGGTDGETSRGDLWELVGDTWQEVPLYGPQPSARTVPALAPLPEARGLVLYGGVGSGETSILRFSSTSPDEDCANGDDDDGDRRVDAADPDCAL
jgi:cysteine-rich repeat protein